MVGTLKNTCMFEEEKITNIVQFIILKFLISNILWHTHGLMYEWLWLAKRFSCGVILEFAWGLCSIDLRKMIKQFYVICLLCSWPETSKLVLNDHRITNISEKTSCLHHNLYNCYLNTSFSDRMLFANTNNNGYT